MYLDHFNNLLNSYTVENGLGKFIPSKQGTYRLTFKHDLVVNIDALDNSGVILIYAEVGPVPEQMQAEIHQALLQANFPGYETRHNTLALDEQKNTVMLVKPLLGYDINIVVFQKSLDAFVSALSLWRQKLRDGHLVHSADERKDDAPCGRYIRG